MLLRVSTSVMLIGLLASCAGTLPASPERFVYSPYKHINQGLPPDAPVISGAAGPYAAAGARTLTWAFATGECGQETWGGVDAEGFARANVPLFRRTGVGNIVSTGGEGGVFTCGSEAGMDAFIRRYASPFLRGIDFDIEGRQSPQQIDELVRSIQAVRGRHPRLRFSFTLATHAAEDDSRRSLNALGASVLAAIRKVGLQDFWINLMVMNYGAPEPAHCVRDGDRCDMGRSARQAAENVHLRYGIPYRQLELTVMLGENDVAANAFLLRDAEPLARFVREQGLGGLHHWSLDRDRPCEAGEPRVSAVCSAMDAPAGAFGRVLEAGLR